MKRAKFGVFLPSEVPFVDSLKNAKECEELGYDDVWFQDHLLPKQTECWTTLSALAVATTRIRLGSLLTCNLFRSPVLLAKMASTVDNISNGRLEFGIGAGNYEKEFLSYGLGYPGAKERLDRLRESTEVITRLWTQDEMTFAGKYYSLSKAEMFPKPFQKPHPPITIGGTGMKATVAFAAKVANRYNPLALGLTPKKSEMFFSSLDKECERIGRRSDEIDKVWFGVIHVSDDAEMLDQTRREMNQESIDASIIGSPRQCITRIEEYLQRGVTHFILYTSNNLLVSGRTLENLNRFAKEVMSTYE